jgi:hypothetical protein
MWRDDACASLWVVILIIEFYWNGTSIKPNRGGAGPPPLGIELLLLVKQRKHYFVACWNTLWSEKSKQLSHSWNYRLICLSMLPQSGSSIHLGWNDNVSILVMKALDPFVQLALSIGGRIRGPWHTPKERARKVAQGMKISSREYFPCREQQSLPILPPG